MPAIRKKSFITPIFKNGNRRNVLNYRPIAMMGSISKVFDAIMADKLVERMLALIVENQHGFVKNESIVTNLINYIYYIAASRDGTQVYYLYFANAFDLLNHTLLILKLFALDGKLV